MKHKKLTLLTGSMAALAGLTAYGLNGPINPHMPFPITLSRSALRPFREDLLKGNEWAYVCSPETAHNGLPADPNDVVNGLKALEAQVKTGRQAYYHSYTEAEMYADPSLRDVGFYCLESNDAVKRPFVVMVAGGGFHAVCTIFESLPVAAYFQKKGYTCFCLRYRTVPKGAAYPTEEQIGSDVAASMRYIIEHADHFHIDPEHYLIGGFSAGAHVVNTWIHRDYGYRKYQLPKPAAACLMYGYNRNLIDDDYDVPVFSRFCLKDQFFKDPSVFDKFSKHLTELGVANDFQGVEAEHGFGLGSGTNAEGWADDAEQFWKECLD